MLKKTSIIFIMNIFISTLIVSFSFSPGYTKTVIEVTEDGTIYLITSEVGMDDVVEEVTAEELGDIYYNQPVIIPQDTVDVTQTI